MIDFLEN